MKRSITIATTLVLWAVFALLLSPPANAATTVVTSCTWQGASMDWSWYHPASRTPGAAGAAPSFCLRDTDARSSHRLVLQSDNNIVMYGASTSGGCVLWASGTNGNYKARLDFQIDGNVVLYNLSKSANGYLWPVWSSHTYDVRGVSNSRITVANPVRSQQDATPEHWMVQRTTPFLQTMATFGGTCR